ncbi:acetolactate synthase large subunit [Euzebya sp.]|uniref:acetolactate synthase large subunit n=1 Tax=Euzebya sp. TaxID=1971409 RepID=UPI00351569D9
MKVSDLFLRCLEAEGVRYVFGVPGEENADVMISLLDSDIEFIICRHEQGAAFMADLYGRMTGEPGVCLGTLGPGATNLITGVANADMDNSPVVVITGQGATTRLHKDSHQAMDVPKMFEPVTKWGATIWAPQNTTEVVRKAFKLARAEHPGATHIELPEDVAKADVDDEPIVPGMKVRRPAAEDKAVARAVELIAAAERPIVLAGHGCVRTRVTTQLNRLIDETGMYVTTTFMAKGAVSDRHPQSLFAAGLGARDHVIDAFEDADCVICVGYDFTEWHPDRWNVVGDGGTPKDIIHIDFEPAEVDSAYRPAVEVVGDLANALWQINESLTAACRDKGTEALARMRRTLEFEILEEHAMDPGFPVKPQRALHDIRAELADDDILISDVGAHKMWTARHYPTYEPGTCIISNGFCSMGIALPGAIAAKLVHPDRRVVGLMGDGGFMMNVQELDTAFQYGIAPTYVVWDDSAYGLIAWKQEAHFGRTSHTTMRHHDLVAVAQGFGCHAVRIESTDELRPALTEAFAVTDRPSVVVVPIDYSENMRLTKRLGQVVAH